MEYKYHPAFKHLVFFVIVYLFLRHQELMSNELLFINSIIITVFLIILDHLFIHNHLTPLQSLSDQYFDDIDIVQLEQELLDEEKEERVDKKDKKKKGSKSKKNKVEKMTHIKEDSNVVVKDTKCINSNNISNNNSMMTHDEYVNIGLNNYDNYDKYNSNNFNNLNDNIDEYPEYLAYNE